VPKDVGRPTLTLALSLAGRGDQMLCGGVIFFEMACGFEVMARIFVCTNEVGPAVPDTWVIIRYSCPAQPDLLTDKWGCQ